MPSEYQWETFAEWKTRWGDVTSLTLLGQRWVILNSLEAAVDLLDKKSASYSDRPTMSMAGELMGWSQALILSPYGDRFRDIRRLLHRYLGSRGQFDRIEPFYGLLQYETHRFVTRLLHSPEHFVDHIRKSAGGIILQMGYGYRVKDGADPLVQLVDRALDGLTAAATPGSFLVDIVPALRFVPSWFPGASWKRKAASWRAETRAMADVPFEMAKDEAAHGGEGTNLIGDNIGQATSEQQKYHLKMAAASLYAGGADTTVSSLSTFFLAMARYPDVQRKAQQELDAVVKSDRMPTMADYGRLPYIRALVSECLRWHPIGPLGIPHQSTEDDVYRGYFLPKGTVFVANIWYMTRDPKIYSDPSEFKPERFLEGDGRVPEQDPRYSVFGFGRRICPGINLADASIFLMCATTLALFDIRPVVEDGKEIIPEVAYTTGTISYPKPFRCSIKPRSAKAEALITG
ncbi:hypothetical protein PHLGIDRAFT_89231 [Phlebiopsis gigantea 11061_1 CR5-6]|uniref:Cytochrome P450 n=1 Tax=Phlebiopsis gigantea (strain 11061_1 CR5-6) TaxID=745531 RepID=A0A0C3NRA1_PHLG1|nr:hypothetical protein PHLGIDRAFT_89231 [Phlebiopsis gigantea 11061_1 CR5-6]